MPDAIYDVKIRKFTRRLLTWYEQHGRNFPWRQAGQSLYRLVVTEILVQRTKAETVSAFYEGFFDQFPDWESLASANQQEVEECLKPIGLWRQRAPRLIELARAVVKSGSELPHTRDELEGLPAVGQYVASAALLFQGVEDAPLLDAGMARVLERHFGPRYLTDIRYDPYLQQLAADVVGHDQSIFLNWAILDLAALVCKKDPLCEHCPVKSTCRFWLGKA